jgi:hypothetical protein
MPSSSSVRALRIGSSKMAIVEAFGPPDFEQAIIPEEPWRPCVGYELGYYFSMLEARQ